MRINMILAISDIHLGYEKCNKEAFNKFLDEIKSINMEHFIILGDLFDLWRKNNVEVILENEDILEKIMDLNTENIHYIVGNHDYYIYKLGLIYKENFPFTISKNLRLEDGGNKFYFTHGYELEVMSYEPMTLSMYEETSEKMCFDDKILGGFVGQAWDIIHGNDLKEKIEGNITEKLGLTPYERFESSKEPKKITKLANSRSKGFLLGMKPEEILVFGHTHDPYINKTKTVANTGSWVNELEDEKYQNSYLEINNGNMELKFFKR
jgi:UDP-2,3-diacylglucosamine pyrophosphatase LpxH